MQVKAIRSDAVYRKIMQAPAEKKDDIYRYELMMPFKKKMGLLRRAHEGALSPWIRCCDGK